MHGDLALWHRQSSILGGVGGQLVERKANVACRVRIEAKRRSIDRNLHPIQKTKRGQLQAHEFVDASSVPIIGDEKIEGVTKGERPP